MKDKIIASLVLTFGIMIILGSLYLMHSYDASSADNIVRYYGKDDAWACELHWSGSGKPENNVCNGIVKLMDGNGRRMALKFMCIPALEAQCHGDWVKDECSQFGAESHRQGVILGGGTSFNLPMLGAGEKVTFSVTPGTLKLIKQHSKGAKNEQVR